MSRVFDFTLGSNRSDGEPQWYETRTEGDVTIRYIADRRAAIQPEIGKTRFMCVVSPKAVFEATNGRFKIVPVTPTLQLKQLKSAEECVEKIDIPTSPTEEEDQAVSRIRVIRGEHMFSQDSGRRKGRRRRVYRMPGECSKEGRPRDRKLGKGGKNKNGKKKATAR